MTKINLTNVRKKVLIITYYWPPSGGIGVLRCLKIAKYLRNFGWEPVIYTAKDAHYPTIDSSNEKDVPENCTILKQKIWEPYHIYKFITGKKKNANVNDVLMSMDKKAGIAHNFSVWVRSNFFIPDARALWIKPSVTFLSAYLKENPVDAMFTCGPPHTNTRIATLLKQKFGIPYLSDFQDPWTQVDYFKQLKLTNWGLKKHKRLEQEAFEAANAITIVSEYWKKDLESIGGQNVSVLYWGYDPDDFKPITPSIDKKFTLSHLGIMGHDRNPTILFKVIKELIDEVSGFESDFELKLVGQIDFSVKEQYQKLGIEKNVNFIGSVDRTTALQLTCNSNALLLLLNQQENAQGRVPGKFFEYLASNRPIMVLGPTDGDVALIVDKTKRGTSFNYDNHSGIKEMLLNLYDMFKKGTLVQPLTGNIEAYSHPVLTGKVATLLDKITASKKH
ncbi:MAG: glycosyltransferase involved in cell wall biosynthesis [Saprospiraceae bacterium]|jgi:glycosyltransferase involved in cell wall biosynthesis